MGGRSVCVEQRCVKDGRLLTLPVTFWRVSDSALSAHHEGELGRSPPDRKGLAWCSFSSASHLPSPGLPCPTSLIRSSFQPYAAFLELRYSCATSTRLYQSR